MRLVTRLSIIALITIALAFSVSSSAQRSNPNKTQALTNVRVMDGSGGRPQPNMIANQDIGDPRVIAELRNLVKMWDDATTKGDAATLDRLLADEFSFVPGARKAQYLEFVKTRTADTFIESAVSDNVQVQVYGDTAVVTGTDTVKGKSRGQSYENKYVYLDVWVKRDNRWQCVKVASTQIN